MCVDILARSYRVYAMICENVVNVIAFQFSRKHTNSLVNTLTHEKKHTHKRFERNELTDVKKVNQQYQHVKKELHYKNEANPFEGNKRRKADNKIYLHIRFRTAFACALSHMHTSVSFACKFISFYLYLRI